MIRSPISGESLVVFSLALPEFGVRPWFSQGPPALTLVVPDDKDQAVDVSESIGLRVVSGGDSVPVDALNRCDADHYYTCLSRDTQGFLVDFNNPACHTHSLAPVVLKHPAEESPSLMSFERIIRPCRRMNQRTGLCAHRELDSFFGKLHALSTDQVDTVIRWGQFGDSLTAWDHWTNQLRNLLQAEFGDGGRGYMPLRLPRDGYGTGGLRLSYKGWESVPVTRRRWFPHGLSGLTFQNPELDATTTVSTSRVPTFIKRVGILYERNSLRTSARVESKGFRKAHEFKVGRGPQLDWITLPKRSQSFTLSRFTARRDLQGLFVETGRSGIVIDNLGLVSLRAEQLLRISRQRWAKMVSDRKLDVGSFWFGAVSGTKPIWHFDKPTENWLAKEEAFYLKLVNRFRAARPQGECMIISHLTRAYNNRKENSIQLLPTVIPTIAMQRKVAEQAGCGFWSSFNAMGGASAANDWRQQAPPLLSSDLRHPTKSGYQVLARLFHQALLHEFASFIKESNYRQQALCIVDGARERGPKGGLTLTGVKRK